MTKYADAGLPHDPDSFKVLTEISIIAHKVDTAFQRRLPAGMSTAQFGILNHLVRLNTQETVSQLAGAMQVSQPTMTSNVKKMLEKGWLKAISGEDKRQKLLSVSDSGKRARQDALDLVGPEMAALFSVIENKEIAALLPPLKRLRIALDQQA